MILRIPPACKTLALRVLRFAQRHPGLIAVFGFVSGVSSFLLVDRHEAFARVIAIVMLVSWLWLLLEQSIRQFAADRLGWWVPTGLLRYGTQMIHQESLFFVLLTALPLILRVPTGDSYKLALAVAVVLSLPSLAGSITLPAGWRKLAMVGLLMALAAGGWLARQWVPPATLWLTEVAITTALDSAARAPGDSLTEISRSQLRRDGLYAYTAINAPLGLREHVHYLWLHEGRRVDRITLDIRGGRDKGYRAWTHKLNFPADPSGRWLVKVVTDTGQMIGILRFRVTPD